MCVFMGVYVCVEINLFIRINLKGGLFGRLSVGKISLLEWDAAEVLGWLVLSRA